MSETSVEHKVLSVLRERLKDEQMPIEREMRLFELGDSLDRVEAIMELEDEFEISIPDEDTERFQTVGELIDYLEHRLTAATAAAGPGGPTSDAPSSA